MNLRSINFSLLCVHTFFGVSGINYFILSVFRSQFFSATHISTILLFTVLYIFSTIHSADNLFYFVSIYKFLIVCFIFLYASSQFNSLNILKLIYWVHLIGLVYSNLFRPDEFQFAGFFREPSYFFQSLFVFTSLFFGQRNYFRLVVVYGFLAFIGGSDFGAFATIVLLFLGITPKFSPSVLWFAFTIFFVVYALFPLFLYDAPQELLNLLLEYGGNRMARIFKGIYMLENGLWGIGFGLAAANPVSIEEFAPMLALSGETVPLIGAPVANGVLWLLVEAGWFGLIFLFVGFCWLAIKCSDGNKACFVVIVSILAATFLDSNVFRPEFVTALGIAASKKAI